MLRASVGLWGGLIVMLSCGEASAEARAPDLYGIDFTTPYDGEKTMIDVMVQEEMELSLHQVDTGLGGQGYLVETSDGGICELATVFHLPPGTLPSEAFDLLEDMRGDAEAKYGAPSETSGPQKRPSEYVWRAGHAGERLPAGVARLEISLGWIGGSPVAAVLKGNHDRCAGVTALALP